MQTNHNLGAIGLLAATTLIAGFFAYLYTEKRQRYLQVWTAAWCLLTVHYLCVVLGPSLGASRWFMVGSQFSLSAAALAFFCSARLYANAPPWTRWMLSAGILLAAWTMAYRFGKFGIPPIYPTVTVFLGVAWVFWRESRRQETVIDFLLALVFFCWAPTVLLIMRLRQANAVGLPDFIVLAGAPPLLAAVLMVMAIHEEERRRVERNILALTNLNLSTSSFMGAEIEKTLSQALDRVLKVARLPAGAIFLQHADSHGPAAVVSAGLDGSFCRAAEEDHFDDLWIELIARMGGLKVFRDLGRDPILAETVQDEAFSSLQRLALKAGLRTMVGISLQAKEQPFGVLLLGTPDKRRFTKAELRLLLALGHQIAAAVENSHLIQQTSRRSEELHVLNDIGRALSSTLDPEALFEKIFEGLQWMVNVNNFSIVLYDAAKNLLCYELDIADGIRLPKHASPIGNQVADHILRTGEPLLVRKDLAKEFGDRGIEAIGSAKSFCGVPLVAYDRAIGVMLIYSSQEGSYDQEHIAMMSVLASEASIAIENARLFRQERAKSRQLSLLNNISRNAIATLNPDEMLANIAEQLEGGLAFDHVGIGLLDYASKEVVIQAESGRRRGALRRRFTLGTNLVGTVARTGQMAVARNATGSDETRPVLEDSASAIALPLLYADQLHGVLYVETAEPTEFSAEDILLLHTLSDLISGALHNAFAFQKAQEQAITDGLTGIKTHRFFMEALAAEWKRSTRAARAFALVLIDLDHFKFVNDFHGHLEGDLVLKRVARLLEQTCRRSDVVARYGGDEFVILMPETNAEQGYQLAEKLCSCIYSDSPLREKNITASVGVATFPLHGSTPQALIQIADASMYLSKHQGGNTVSSASHFDSDETKKWKQDVLEAYLGVTLKRLFSTGPDAFREIHGRLAQFSQSLALTNSAPDGSGDGHSAEVVNSVIKHPVFHSAVMETITSLALAIDAKDHYTQGHSPKVAAYAALLAGSLGLQEQQIEQVHLGALLHDIGKVGIPAAILNKSGPLNPEEWGIMKEHVRLGDQLLESLDNFAGVREMIRHHHEMFDGSGYPDGLAGEQIPLGARIIAIADAYDTITSERTYKKARTASSARIELERCAGNQFDPCLVQVFLQALQQMPFPLIESATTPARPIAQ